MMWRDRAACLDYPAEWWVIEPRGEAGTQLNRKAAAICLTCPVRWDCWVDAVDQGDIGVIRAGARLGDPPKLDGFPIPKSCKTCGEDFLAFMRSEKNCGERCRERAGNQRAKERRAA